MTTESKELQAQRERYNSGRDNKELASRNREAFKTILNTIQLNDNAEVPMITVTMMYPNYDDLEQSMTEDELNFRMKLLENAGLISVREASFGTQMVSITEYGAQRYAA
ncbi:hypothetical protein ACPV3A_16900 [Paenibacillus sp. Dod16]|uniref:hypothetical protein n=1 Tax=Paenibacillus sp. Dod16 TaxID=3416392 RepID=UPI003CF4F1FF